MTDSPGCPSWVLVVDDDEDLREALVDLLGDEGLSAVPAENGRAALDRLHANGTPCAIILDLMMPVMSGEEFRRAQLGDAQLKGVPVLVLSAKHDGRTVASRMGAAAYFEKPIRDVNKLVTTLRDLCA